MKAAEQLLTVRLPWAPGEVWQVVAAAGGGSGEVAEGECRFCFAPHDDDDDGGALVSPCACQGTQRFVHVRCLRQWQTASLRAGTAEKAQRCDVCQQQFQLPPPVLPFRERLRLGVVWTCSSFLRGWLVCAAGASLFGAAAGLAAAAELAYVGFSDLFMYLDDRAATSALFSLASTLLLPVMAPLGAVSAYFAVVCCVSAGAVMGMAAGITLPVIAVWEAGRLALGAICKS